MLIINFVKQYLLYAVFYLSLIFVYTHDSIIALVICGIFIHILLGISVYSLYIDNSNVPKDATYKNILCIIAEVIVMLVVFGIRDHWYIFIVTLIYFILFSVTAYEKHKETKMR